MAAWTANSQALDCPGKSPAAHLGNFVYGSWKKVLMHHRKAIRKVDGNLAEIRYAVLQNEKFMGKRYLDYVVDEDELGRYLLRYAKPLDPTSPPLSLDTPIVDYPRYTLDFEKLLAAGGDPNIFGVAEEPAVVARSPLVAGGGGGALPEPPSPALFQALAGGGGAALREPSPALFAPLEGHGAAPAAAPAAAAADEEEPPTARKRARTPGGGAPGAAGETAEAYAIMQRQAAEIRALNAELGVLRNENTKLREQCTEKGTDFREALDGANLRIARLADTCTRAGLPLPG